MDNHAFLVWMSMNPEVARNPEQIAEWATDIIQLGFENKNEYTPEQAMIVTLLSIFWKQQNFVPNGRGEMLDKYRPILTLLTIAKSMSYRFSIRHKVIYGLSISDVLRNYISDEQFAQLLAERLRQMDLEYLSSLNQPFRGG